MNQAGILGAALLLAACQGQQGNDQAGTKGAGENGAEALSLRPGESARFIDGAAAWLEAGQWEAVMEVTADHRPNASGGGDPQTIRLCLPPEQSQQPGASFLLARNREGEICEYRHFSMEAGHIFAAGECGPEGSRIFFSAAGPFTPTNYELNVRAQSSSGGVTFDNDVRVTSRRTGDCPPG